MRFSLRLSLCALGLAGLAAPAFGQAMVCTGRNLLDDLKASDPARYDAIRVTADATPHTGKRLWQIELEGARGVSYLFATVPITDERVQRFSPAVQNALSKVRRVAVDVTNFEPGRVAEGLNTLHGIGKLVLKDGSTLASHLTPVEQQTTVRALARSGLPADLAARAQPWAVMVMLSTGDCEQKRLRSGKPQLNEFIAGLAEQRGLGTVDMETVETQFEAVASLPEAMQVSLLKGRVAAVPLDNDYVETLAQLYLAKDLGVIWPLQAALARKAGTSEDALQTYYQNVIVERAKRLGNRLHQHLVSGSVFVAIDQSLLVGTDGLVAKLEATPGVTITPIE